MCDSHFEREKMCNICLKTFRTGEKNLIFVVVCYWVSRPLPPTHTPVSIFVLFISISKKFPLVMLEIKCAQKGVQKFSLCHLNV